MKTDSALWQRIEEYAPGGEAHTTFMHKLQRENGWDRAFAEQAVAEYKRFIYLAAIAATPLAPMPAIDTVWHLHLTFSRCYWGAFCRDVLGKPLHHDPANAGEESATAAAYQAMRTLYEREFGVSPQGPCWQLPRQRRGLVPMGAAVALLGGMGLAVAENSAHIQTPESGLPIWKWVSYVMIVMACVGVVRWLGSLGQRKRSLRWRDKDKRAKDRDNSSGGCGSSCGSSCGGGCGGGGD